MADYRKKAREAGGEIVRRLREPLVAFGRLFGGDDGPDDPPRGLIRVGCDEHGQPILAPVRSPGARNLVGPCPEEGK
jgi:hypothetical protein